MAPRVCVLGISVTNLDEAVDFYCNKLGFTLKQRWGDELVQLEHEGQPVILNKAEQPAQIDYPRTAQSVYGFETEDLESTMSELRAKGVQFLFDRPRPFPAGIFTAFRDPSGNVHELLEFRE